MGDYKRGGDVDKIEKKRLGAPLVSQGGAWGRGRSACTQERVVAVFVPRIALSSHWLRRTIAAFSLAWPLCPPSPAAFSIGSREKARGGNRPIATRGKLKLRAARQAFNPLCTTQERKVRRCSWQGRFCEFAEHSLAFSREQGKNIGACFILHGREGVKFSKQIKIKCSRTFAKQ